MKRSDPDAGPELKQDWPATHRNRQAILEVLRKVLPPTGTVLEIASGSGQHAAFFAPALPHLDWQPSDIDDENLASIAAWRAEVGAPNLLAPIRLDVCERPWPEDFAEALFCANMIHIAPWAVTEALFRGAGDLMDGGAVLCLYGPFRVDGDWKAPSNEAFDRSLRGRDPSWGVRELAEVTRVANSAGFGREEIFEMPANNLTVVFRRRSG